jgi:osmotically-inducible protein OsmY
MHAYLHHLVRRANDQLQRTPHLTGTRVSCDGRDGVLRLRGQLTSYYHKQVAQEIVRQLDGAFELVNEIEVTAD